MIGYEEINNGCGVISIHIPFSGAGGLDLGLEQAGLKPAMYLDSDPLCCETLRRNRPWTPVLQENIANVSIEEILSVAGIPGDKVFAVVGGPPCQPFSTGGKRQTISDERGNLFAQFLRVVNEVRPLYFIFENVAQIITAAVRHRPIAERPGKNWNLSNYSLVSKEYTEENGALPLQNDELSGSLLSVILEEFGRIGYNLTFGVLNAADYGVPQKRMRFILTGTRLPYDLMLPRPTHSFDGLDLPLWRSLRDAIGDLVETEPLHSNYSPAFQEYFRLIPPGGNWRDLPTELQRKALGEKAFVAGGGKTGFFRRLSWAEPAPTIVGKPNRKSSALCHPSELRPLTVREAARVQCFPDDWIFAGGMHAQYLQIGNAVPVGLGSAVGRNLVSAHLSYMNANLILSTVPIDSWTTKKEQMIFESRAVLKAAARNKRKKQISSSLLTVR